MANKGEQTRDQILAAALSIIQEKGYDKANMRAIAKRAGLSLGAAYYYFPSKEHIIQAYYEANFEQFLPAAEAVIEAGGGFEKMLAGVLTELYRTAAPWHGVSAALFRAAALPGSALSPFSEASAPLRRRAIELFGRVAERGALKTSPLLAPFLPLLLWLFHILITLFWIYDTSQAQRRTDAFIAAIVPILGRLLSLSRLTPLRPVLRAGLKLFTFFRLPEIPVLPSKEGG